MPIDHCSEEAIDENLLFAKREQREREVARFREAEDRWIETIAKRRNKAVGEGDIRELLLALADDLCAWGDNLKEYLFQHCDQKCDDELTRSFHTHPYLGPGHIEIQIPWVVREIVGSHEAYEMIEFHKSREYALAFGERFEILNQARLEFSRKIVEYTARYGRDMILEPFLALDEFRQELQVQARYLARHAVLVANQFPNLHPTPSTVSASQASQTSTQQPDTPKDLEQVNASVAEGSKRQPIAVPWWKGTDPNSPELNWEPEWLSVSDMTPEAILDIVKEFRSTVNEMQSAPFVIGRWAEMKVCEECEKLAVLATGYGLDPKPMLQMAWNIGKNRFKAGDWPFPAAFQSCSFLLAEIETRAKSAVVRRRSQAGYVDEPPVGNNEPQPLEQEQPYSLLPPTLFQWRHEPPVELTPQQWRLLSYCLDNRRAPVQEVADHLWNDGTASDKTEAAIDSLKSKLNTRLAEADIPVSVSRKAGFLLLAIDG